MKFIIGIIGMILAGLLAAQFLPWWSVVLVCFIAGAMLNMKSWKSFLCGLLAIFLLWGLSAGWDFHHGSYVIANRMGDLLGGVSGVAMMFITALIGGLLGGLGSMSGGYFRKIFS